MTDTQLPYSTDTLSTKPEQTIDKRNPKKFLKVITNPLFLMLVLFGLPYALSWYFMYGGDPITFEKPNNNGELVSPMIAFGEFSLPFSFGVAATCLIAIVLNLLLRVFQIYQAKTKRKPPAD